MGRTGKSNLTEQPEIIDLLQVLMENGLQKEKKEVESLVSYLDNMQEQFGQVLLELQEVKGQFQQMQESKVKLSVRQYVNQAEGKCLEVGKQFDRVRKNFLQSSQNAVEVFREKGKDALRKVVSAMKIPNTFMLMEKVLHGAAEDMTYRVAQMAALNKELHVAGSHTKNIGRILTGKEVKAVGEQIPEQGLIYKISKSFLAMSGRLSSMERTAIGIKKRLEQFTQKEEQKPSVKGELKKLKEEKKIQPQLSDPVKEQGRE